MKKNIIILTFQIMIASNLFAQNTLSTAIDIGYKSSSFTYSNTQNTIYLSDEYEDRSSNDVFYKITITRPMDLIISHCGSELEDTYLHLLNNTGGLINENDNSDGVVCENNLQSYLRIDDMQPGTYYIVCEGYCENGNITLTLEGVRPIESTNEYDGIDPSTDQNYILTVVPTIAVKSTDNLGTNQSLQTIQYFDGLGRPFETVQRNITPSKNDLISHKEYDYSGRDEKVWAPIPISDNQGASVDIVSFSNSSTGYYGDNKAFQLTEYEPSPLNRVTGQYSLGANWQNQNKKVSTLYELNSASEVTYYFVNSEKKLQRQGYYEANTLFKTITLDEDNKKVTEFTDKQGRVVMVRNAEDVNTYYVYNDLNQKCYVLPPLASDAMTSDIIYEDTHDKLVKFAYHYKYDERGNCVEKRLPGCEPIFMVYDNADRLILSQDGNQRVKTSYKQWTVNKYDVFGRLVYTGLMYNNYSRLQLQQVIKDLVIVEEYDGSATLANTGYTCKYFVGEITPILVNYYDDYRFLDKLTANEQSYLAHQDPPPGAYSTQYKDADNQVNAKGLLTGTRTWVLDDVISQYLVSVNYYDYKGQVVQSRSSNHLGGFDIVYNGYDFTGHLTKTHHTQSTQYKSPVVEITTNEYDHANRLKKVKYQIGNYPEITLSEIKYDELGRMIEKKRHDLTDLELYSYNIRNWLKQKTSGTFNEFLYYNGDVPIPGLDTYNGNIAMSGVKSGPITKSYAFTYDQLNRLTNGKGYYRTSGAYNPYGYDESFGFDKNGNINFLQRKNASTIIDYLSYTYNGNQISNIFDYTGSQNSYAIKEYNNYNTQSDIEFKYDANGNLTVDKDRKIVTMKFNLLNLPDTIQFSNGNQIVNRYAADGRKLGTEFFTQLAALAQPLVEGQVKKQQYSFGFVDQSGIMYINNFEYKTQYGSASLTNLNKVFNAEGYVDEFANSTSYSGFCYYRTDHLGNVCEVWRAAKPGGALAATLQKTFYFPSGLPLSYSTSPGLQPNKYNNKPFIEMHGFDTYDFSARMMYPALGDRFMSLDPLAEDDPSTSPYVYCGNNPVNRVDPDGRFWNYVVGAAAGAAVEYGSQVAANIVNHGFSRSAFTENIDLVDIGVSALEGAATSGGSAIKSIAAKTVIAVGPEIIRNTVDVKTSNEGVKTNVNKAGNVIKNTAIGLTVGTVSTNAKVNVASTTSANKAIQGARTVAHSEGRGLTSKEAKVTAAKARVRNVVLENINKTVSNNVNKAISSSASEVAKRKTDLDER